MRRPPGAWGPLLAMGGALLPGGVLAAGAAAGPGEGALTVPFVPPPLGWGEPSPVARLFLQIPFEAPEPLPPGRLRAELRLLYSNSILLARRPGLALLADVETVQPTASLGVGIGHRLELRAALPFVADWGGVLDRPIGAAEGVFGAANPDRRRRPVDTAAWVLLRDDGRGLARAGTGAGLGDGWIGVKAGILQGAGAVPALSARLSVSVPSGRPPWGAGQWIPSAGILAGWRARRVALRLAAELSVPTGPLRPVALETRPYATLDAGLTVPLRAGLALQLQGSAHGPPLKGTGFAQLDRPTAYVLAGVSARLRAGAVLDLGIAENVFSPYRGADLTLVVALRSP